MHDMRVLYISISVTCLNRHINMETPQVQFGMVLFFGKQQ